MDISKASNFERFVFDLVGRDPARVRELWAKVDRGEAFDLAGTSAMQRLAEFGFVSGTSSHADRLATIRDAWQRYRVMIDPHTADGLKVAQALRRPDENVVCLETALPAKFDDTIREALGREPERPAGFEDLERLPQRFTVMAADVAQVKAFIEREVAR
jgi:threonine synthase